MAARDSQAEAKEKAAIIEQEKEVQEREREIATEAKQKAAEAAVGESAEQRVAFEDVAAARAVEEQKAARAKEEAEEQRADAEEINAEAMLELKDELLAKEKELHNLKKQCDERKTSLRKESRLMLAVFHELSMRYHQLWSQYNSLVEDLDRRVPP